MSTMARTLSLVLCSILVVTGCVAPAFSPPRTRVANISRLVVVAVEPPPLLVTDVRVASSVSNLGEAIIVGTPPVPGAEALVVLGGVVMLIEWAASGTDPITRSHEKFLRLSDLLTKGLVWSPTRELAGEATSQLRSRECLNKSCRGRLQGPHSLVNDHREASRQTPNSA